MAAIDMGRKRIVEGRIERDVDPAADHVVIQHEARIEGRAQHHFAGRGMGIERGAVLGLEQQARDLDRHHHGAIAQQHGLAVLEPQIGQALAHGRFLRAPGCRSDPLAH